MREPASEAFNMKSHRSLLRSVHGSGRKLPRRSLPSPFGASRNRGRSASRVLVCESLENRLLLTAVRDLSGFATDALPEQDDVSSGPVDIGFEIDFGGVSYGQLFVNENGNVTFGAPFSEIPTTAGELERDRTLADLQIPIVSAYWADVDAVVQGSVTYGSDQVDGRPAWGVTWTNVGYGDGHDDLGNDFQLVLIDRSEVEPGAFDIEFNYDQVQWETGDRSGGDDGFFGASARVGYSDGTRRNPARFWNLWEVARRFPD